MGQGGCLLVGLAGLEPATFRPPDGRATRLRHSPNMGAVYQSRRREQAHYVLEIHLYAHLCLQGA